MKLNPSFIYLLLAVLTTNLAFSFYTMALTYFVYGATNSVFYSSLVTFISVGAKVLSGLWIGSITEKIKRKSLLIYSISIQLISMVLLYFLTNIEVFIVVIYLIVYILSFANGTFMPIKSKILKETLEEQDMSKGLSILNSIDQILLFSGWVLGAWIISLIGNNNLLLISVILLLIAFMSVLKIKTDNVTEERANKGTIGKISDLLKLLNSKPLIKNLIIIECLEVLIGSVWIGSITLKFVQNHLHQNIEWWGYINASYYLGTILGAFIVMKFSKIFQNRPAKIIIYFIAIYGFLLIIYSINALSIFAIILVIFIGPILQIKEIVQESYLINMISHKDLVKLTGLKNALVQMSFLLSILMVGAITEVIKIQYVYTISGVFSCLIALYFYCFAKKYFKEQKY
ncbi:MFS transporter [Staphylococcus kloosii]|jgi:MFS family permease|uniref:MFS transporter n=1 Tax=Staphylococcus kloosii TaxID=29384 RepID=UPI000D1DCE28|nr:MFS transporter [Staphylococcus kloosii]MBF7023050.1 MFS transporter [Staphylococcus kloosii]PTJ79042.1 hypothetical protein BUZ59_05205 [Staphylococcus kloosii]